MIVWFKSYIYIYIFIGFLLPWSSNYWHKRHAAAAKSLQSCLTLCDPIDGSPPGSTVPGILQARTLEWVAFPSPVHESEKWKLSCSVVFDSQRPHGLQPTRLLCPWDSPGKSTGVGCHCHLRYYFNWRLITLQYCGSFCHILTWINHRCTCVPPS